MDRIELVEVGPRDGLQNIKQLVPTETKIRLIHALAAAGFKRMEIGSFVSPKAIPQMQDMDDVVRGLGPMDGVTGIALVPNSKGARRAAGASGSDAAKKICQKLSEESLDVSLDGERVHGGRVPVHHLALLVHEELPEVPLDVVPEERLRPGDLLRLLHVLEQI